jgi:putative glutamine amidotransferase
VASGDGVTAPFVAILCGRSPAERYSTHRGYVSSVVAVGGIPLLIPCGPDTDPGLVAQAVEHCHALVATGGGDVGPELSPGAAGAACALLDVDPARDITEIAAVEQALARGRRVLGVCRGAQLLAVMAGGALVPDLVENGFSGHWDEARQHEPVHAVRAEAYSTVADVLGSVDRVNSIHHQAVADPGRDLRATAWSDDGVIEAVEAPGMLGVQWHPERLSHQDRRHLAPFAWVMGA